MKGTTITVENIINLNPGPARHIVVLRQMGHDASRVPERHGAAAVWKDYQSLGGEVATFNTVAAISPNPNPNGQVWDLL